MNQQDLENISNKEIKELWQETVSEARGSSAKLSLPKHRRKPMSRAMTGSITSDGFGNRIAGQRPPTKTVRTLRRCQRLRPRIGTG